MRGAFREPVENPVAPIRFGRTYERITTMEGEPLIGRTWNKLATVRLGQCSRVLPRVWVCPLLKAEMRIGVPGCSGQPDSFVSPGERGGLALAPAKWNRKAGFRNRAYSPGTRDVFPVQRLLPVGREVRRAS